METKIEFNLLQTASDGEEHSVRNGFLSITAAKDFAQSWAGRVAQEFKIQEVVTTRKTVEIFEVAAAQPIEWHEVASNMASVYAQSVDWSDEDYLALSETDRAKVREYVEHETDNCENCGWTFEVSYLSHTDYGNVCDRCESDLAEEEDESDED